MVMAGTQTIVQLSDELLTWLDDVAEQRHISHSELIRQAIRAFLPESEENTSPAGLSMAIDACHRRPRTRGATLTPCPTPSLWKPPNVSMLRNGRQGKVRGSALP